MEYRSLVCLGASRIIRTLVLLALIVKTFSSPIAYFAAVSEVGVMLGLELVLLRRVLLAIYAMRFLASVLKSSFSTAQPPAL